MTDKTATRVVFSEPFCTSGTSPTGRPTHRPTTLHLVGPGQVGRAFLRLLPDTPLRLIGVSDTSATLHHRDGLDPVALARFKASRQTLATVDGAESLPVELALDFVDADIVVDTTPTDVDRGAIAVRRCEGVLRRGGSLALAAKDALCTAGARLLAGAHGGHAAHGAYAAHGAHGAHGTHAGHIGINAALGGTGRALLRELDLLWRECTGLQLVGNASTTAVIESVERGDSIAAGIAAAQAGGSLEADAELDLSGRDAATKLAVVVGVLWRRTVPLASIACQHLGELRAETLRARARAGVTTRLVAEATPDGALSVGYRAVQRTSPLAVPGDRVAYTYRLRGGATRVHVGHGIGPVGTARALLDDVLALSAVRDAHRDLQVAGGVS